MKKTPSKTKHSKESAKTFMKDSPTRCHSVTVQRFMIASQVHPSNCCDRNMMAQHVEMRKGKHFSKIRFDVWWRW